MVLTATFKTQQRPKCSLHAITPKNGEQAVSDGLVEHVRIHIDRPLEGDPIPTRLRRNRGGRNHHRLDKTNIPDAGLLPIPSRSYSDVLSNPFKTPKHKRRVEGLSRQVGLTLGVAQNF